MRSTLGVGWVVVLSTLRVEDSVEKEDAVIGEVSVAVSVAVDVAGRRDSARV